MSALASLLPDLTAVLPAVLFFVFAGVAIVSAAAAATAARIVHAAFGLMGAFLGVAGIYALLGSDFLALVQVIVYVGGILVLLVFGVLLTGRAKSTLGLEKPAGVVGGVLVGAALLFGLVFAIRATDFHAIASPPDPQPTTAAIGRALLSADQYIFPFEFVSVFLLLALVGATYLVRRRRDAK